MEEDEKTKSSRSKLHFEESMKYARRSQSRGFGSEFRFAERSEATAGVGSDPFAASEKKRTRSNREKNGSFSGVFGAQEEDDAPSENVEPRSVLPGEEAAAASEGEAPPSPSAVGERLPCFPPQSVWPCSVLLASMASSCVSFEYILALFSMRDTADHWISGTPTLNKLGSRLGKSFLLSSFRGQQTPESNSSFIKPLLPSKVDSRDEQQQRRSSQSLLAPPVPAHRSSVRKPRTDYKPVRAVSHELPATPRQCSFSQGVINGVNVLCGVGILAAPYAIKEGGWIGLSVLLLYAILTFYTAILLRLCLDSEQALRPTLTSSARQHLYRSYCGLNYPLLGTLCNFCISTLLFAAAAAMGFVLFGLSTQSQFTLNMPHKFVASNVNWLDNGLLMSLIGSFLTMLVALILPCLCYLRIARSKATRTEVSMCTVILIVGVVSSAFGTFSAISTIISSLN
ncbi:hypothetical protein HPP92_022401 [Vanilla planifolia]|uniref:Amino acid transporter transmembrane domain-containing protein n=1 Tax=Vanilla planifolia TaxID=51239 RepID=A0A835PY64_VANPL|nr:hypothetical protein HPP92_022401 [Vanilla planifolia]